MAFDNEPRPITFILWLCVSKDTFACQSVSCQSVSCRSVCMYYVDDECSGKVLKKKRLLTAFKTSFDVGKLSVAIFCCTFFLFGCNYVLNTDTDTHHLRQIICVVYSTSKTMCTDCLLSIAPVGNSIGVEYQYNGISSS